MRVYPIIAAVLAAMALASAQQVPLPRPRPPGLGPAAAPEPSACQAELASRAVFEPLPPLVGPGGCGAPDVVRLDAVIMPDKTHVALQPPPTLRCTMAGAVADWVRADLGPQAAEMGAPMKAIENYDSYDCRGMNRVTGAKLSEHGRANALDLRSLTLADGRTIHPTDVAVSRDFRERMRASACERFATVLGPGSDGYHEEHIHVDLAERHGGYRICHWEIREPAPPAPVVNVPLPRPRPPFSLAGH
ncbi:MAG TPA: extensin family protein [Xanthobacteraceae bacterium]|nr:extensin family protein [Xanthobacteraceae bacterium]